MLHSLEIQNYRNLRHLTIEKLGRVNLLVGKNNTGKTSVLESISILVNKANPQWIAQIFDERGQNVSRTPNADPEQRIVYNVELLSSLFFGWENKADLSNSIKISALDDLSVEIRFVYFVREIIKQDDGQTTLLKTAIVGFPGESTQVGLEITNNNSSVIIDLDRSLSTFTRPLGGTGSLQFVRTANIVRETNGRLWDKITSSEKKKYIKDALKIIEPSVVDLQFVLPTNDSYATRKRDERIGIVQLEGLDKPTPLYSMGDGINRILTIILAMVNCENGYLLIDEFENGLHYSVQEKLWEIIFYLSERLHVQVFATTHSLDCIEAFSAVLDSGNHGEDAGVMIRLENYEGNIEATVYDADKVRATTHVHVDPR